MFQKQPSLAGYLEPGDATRYEMVAVKTWDTIEVIVRNDGFFDMIVFVNGQDEPYYTMRQREGKETNPFTIKAAKIMRDLLIYTESILRN